MRITAAVSVLAPQLAWIAKLLPARPPIPVLAGVRLDVAEDQVRLTGTDYDTWGSATVEADTEGAGAVVLPGRLLAALVAELPSRYLVTLDVEDHQVRVSCGKTRATLRTLPAEDYPTPPDRPVAIGQIDADVLAAGVGRVAPSASADSTLTMLTGVHLVLSDGGLLLEASDRYRFTRDVLGWEPTLDGAVDNDVLVPRDALVAASRAMTGTVSIGLQDEGAAPVALALSDATRHLSTRLLSDGFLNVDKVLAMLGEVSAEVTVESEPLTAAIRRTRLFAADSVPLRIEVGDGELVVRAGAEGDAGADTVSAQTEAEEPLAVAIRADYLLDALAATRHERTRLSVSTPTKPVLVRSDDDEDTGFFHIVMPIRQTS